MKTRRTVVIAGVAASTAGLAALLTGAVLVWDEAPADACGRQACEASSAAFVPAASGIRVAESGATAPIRSAGVEGLQPLAVLRQAALSNPRDAGRWRALATAHHRKGEYGIAWQALKRAAVLDRGWAASNGGARLLRQYRFDARSAGSRRTER